MSNQQPQSKPPVASVVIPTHNRSELLEAALIALTRQTISPDEFEVVVVADGCTDNTPEIVESFHDKLRISIIEQESQGQASARNVGAMNAAGRLLIFLDDDIEPQPQLIEAHINSHYESTRRVVIGYLPPRLKTQTGYFRTELNGWWESIFQNMRHPGHRFSYSDLVSGNFSLSAVLFDEVGRFDTQYRCHEDYELGIRLLQLGVEFVHSTEALGYHHERSDIPRALNRKYEEGIADVKIGKQYPFLRSTLLMDKLQKFSLLPSQILKLLAIYQPSTGDKLAHFIQKRMIFLEQIRWWSLWRRMLYGLMGYWYWRGVAVELTSIREVKTFLNEIDARAEATPALEINLADGITKAEKTLDDNRPDSVRVMFNQTEVGEIPHEPGSEQLKGAHLRPYLIHHFNYELLKTLASEPDFAYPEISSVLVAKSEKIIKSKEKWS